jgi:hypothetical protein
MKGLKKKPRIIKAPFGLSADEKTKGTKFNFEEITESDLEFEKTIREELEDTENWKEKLNHFEIEKLTSRKIKKILKKSYFPITFEPGKSTEKCPLETIVLKKVSFGNFTILPFFEYRGKGTIDDLYIFLMEKYKDIKLDPSRNTPIEKISWDTYYILSLFLLDLNPEKILVWDKGSYARYLFKFKVEKTENEEENYKIENLFFYTQIDTGVCRLIELIE